MPPSSTTFPSTPLHTIASHSGPINALSFSTNGGTYILTGSSDRQIHLCRSLPSSSSTTTSPSSSTQPIQRYTSHGYSILSLAIAPTNATFASSDASPSGAIFLWDVEKAVTLRRFSGHEAAVNSVVFAGHDPSVLVSGSQDGSVRFWDLRSQNSWKAIQTLTEAGDGVSCVVVGGGPGRGHEVVTGSYDGRVRSYDLRMGVFKTDTLPAAVTSVVPTRDGNAVLVSTLDSTMRLLDTEDGGLLQTFRAEGGFVNKEFRMKATMGKGDGVVVAGSELGGRIFAWDVLKGEVVWKSKDDVHGGKVASAVGWVDKGADVWASGGADGRVVVWGEQKG